MTLWSVKISAYSGDQTSQILTRSGMFVMTRSRMLSFLVAVLFN